MTHKTWKLIAVGAIGIAATAWSLARTGTPQQSAAAPVRIAPPRPTISLFEAARTGDINQVASHVFYGCDVNAANEAGLIPLMLAANRGHTSVVKLLLDKGANPNLADKQGGTALHATVTNVELPNSPDARSKQGIANSNRLEITRVLIAAGGNVNASDRRKNTPLHESVLQPEPDPAVISVLLAHGAEVDARDWQGWTPLCWSVLVGNQAVAAQLVASGANVNSKANNGSPLIHCLYECIVCPVYADTQKRASMVNWLVSVGADVHAGNAHGETILHCAARHNEADLIASLVRAGANVDAQDASGDTPLMEAARWSKLAATKVLLSARPNMAIRNNRGQTAFHIAQQMATPSAPPAGNRQ